MDNYLALILSAFIRNGLLEVRLINLILFCFVYFIFSNRILSEQQAYMMDKCAHIYYFATILFSFLFSKGLVEVITNSDDHISVRATILLGELLHMVSLITSDYVSWQ